MSTSYSWEGKGRYDSFRLRMNFEGVQVKLWDALRTRAISERFWGGVSGKRCYIKCLTLTFTFTFTWLLVGCRAGHMTPRSAVRCTVGIRRLKSLSQRRNRERLRGRLVETTSGVFVENVSMTEMHQQPQVGDFIYDSYQSVPTVWPGVFIVRQDQRAEGYGMVY